MQLLNDQYRAAEGLADVDWLVDAAAGDDPELEIAVQLARGRAYYIMSLDNPGTAEVSRDAYEAAYVAAKERGDKASMALALLPTTWFTDYWADYQATAVANIAESLELAEALGDEDLILDAMAASLRTGTVADQLGACEALMERLEARRDPVRLNAHCFWMMWQYSSFGRFTDAVATCDRGMELADLIGSAPVQYGSIKAIALTEMGRYDDVDAAIGQEVTDDDHPFGQAIASLARSVFLTRIGTWGPAAESLTATLEWADQLTRVWMQYWAGSLMAVVSANCGVESVGTVPDPGSLPAFGQWRTGVAAAQIRVDRRRAHAGGRSGDSRMPAIRRRDARCRSRARPRCRCAGPARRRRPRRSTRRCNPGPGAGRADGVRLADLAPAAGERTRTLRPRSSRRGVRGAGPIRQRVPRARRPNRRSRAA